MFWRLKSHPVLCVGSFGKAAGCVLEKAPVLLNLGLGTGWLQREASLFFERFETNPSVRSSLVVHLTWGHDNKQGPHRPTSAPSFCLRTSLGKQSSEKKHKSHGLSHGRYKTTQPIFFPFYYGAFSFLCQWLSCGLWGPVNWWWVSVDRLQEQNTSLWLILAMVSSERAEDNQV